MLCGVVIAPSIYARIMEAPRTHILLVRTVLCAPSSGGRAMSTPSVPATEIAFVGRWVTRVRPNPMIKGPQPLFRFVIREQGDAQTTQE